LLKPATTFFQLRLPFGQSDKVLNGVTHRLFCGNFILFPELQERTN
jgi:hypothetical protein